MPFNAYDIRGRVPSEINEEFAYSLGVAFSKVIQPNTVVLGHDIRLSGRALVDALSLGFSDSDVKVYDIGLCGTEEVYYATASLKADGGIMVTASHNPSDYNGFKLVRKGAQPISSDSGLHKIKDLMEVGAKRQGGSLVHEEISVRERYVELLLTFVDQNRLKPLRIVANPGNGGAGLVLDAIEATLPFEFIRLNEEPDGEFPNGVPNPLLSEHRFETAQAVLKHGADFGLAWDGDFDRCFFFDENGRFIEGYYIVGMLAALMLDVNPGSKIIHDPRLTWNTIDVVKQAEGLPIESKTGHAFIKEKMRREDALYGGEMSAHHYFRDFFYCDSGMIPWLLVAQCISETGKKLSELVDDRIEKFPCSGEINFVVSDVALVMERVEKIYRIYKPVTSMTDGLSYEMEMWRFNLRCSNTEPVLRLNVETRASVELLEKKVNELIQLINGENLEEADRWVYEKK